MSQIMPKFRTSVGQYLDILPKQLYIWKKD